MNVLHLPYGKGISTLAKALQEQGWNAQSCSFNPNNYYHDLADIPLDFNGSTNKENERNAFFQEAMEQYDLFHFHFGETFYPDQRDLKILAKKGKKLIAHHRGSEVRKLSVARSFDNPYVKVKKSWPEEKINRRLESLSSYVKHAIVCDDELLPYVKPYYRNTYVVPRAIDSSQFTPSYPSSDDKPVIVHAPSNKDLKGTTYVVDAINRLKKEGVDFQFIQIEDQPYEKALQLYQKATIVVDQLRVGSFANLSLEAMAMGKPVICYIREDLVKTYPPELPIVNANPDTIYQQLKMLLHYSERWESLGKRGRKYVEKHHSLEKVAKQLTAIYRKL